MKTGKWSIQKLIYTAMLAAVAGVLMSLEFSVPMMPPFYKVDFSDVPSVIAVFLMGPVSGICVEVIKLLIKLITVGTNTMYVGELANLVALGNGGATLELELLLDQVSRRRGLADEGERAILVDGDLNGDDITHLVLRGSVERLAELHDVDLGGTERGADRRSRVGLAGGNLKLNDGGNLLLSHCHSFPYTNELAISSARTR